MFVIDDYYSYNDDVDERLQAGMSVYGCDLKNSFRHWCLHIVDFI